MEANQEFRRMAAAMDLRIQQLTAEGVHGLAVIERMVGHLPDLHRISVDPLIITSNAVQ